MRTSEIALVTWVFFLLSVQQMELSSEHFDHFEHYERSSIALTAIFALHLCGALGMLAWNRLVGCSEKTVLSIPNNCCQWFGFVVSWILGAFHGEFFSTYMMAREDECVPLWSSFVHDHLLIWWGIWLCILPTSLCLQKIRK